MAKSAIFQLTLVRIPGTTTVVNLSEPVTINQAVESAGENPASWKFLVNGAEVSGDTQVTEHTGQVRMIMSKVKGN